MTARLPLLFLAALLATVPISSKRVFADSDPISPDLQQALRAAGADLGNPVFIRVFKRPQAEFDQNHDISASFNPHPSTMPEPDMHSYLSSYIEDDQWEKKDGRITEYSRNVGQLEVWIRNSSTGQYVLLKTYRVEAYSGPLGPKKEQSDLQTPEGFYSITPRAMNPKSKYVEAMNIGYPNAYDESHAAPGTKLGGEIEIHGNHVSAGCLAMGNRIKDIYALVQAAQKSGGQKQVPVEIFPFPLTNANLSRIPDSSLKRFWEQLKPGFDAFQADHLPPTVSFDSNGNYVFSANLPDGPDSRMLDPDENSCPGN